jgi:tetratricopeptide (TPR) repeat protein
MKREIEFGDEPKDKQGTNDFGAKPKSRGVSFGDERNPEHARSRFYLLWPFFGGAIASFLFWACYELNLFFGAAGDKPVAAFTTQLILCLVALGFLISPIARTEARAMRKHKREGGLKIDSLALRTALASLLLTGAMLGYVSHVNVWGQTVRVILWKGLLPPGNLELANRTAQVSATFILQDDPQRAEPMLWDTLRLRQQGLSPTDPQIAYAQEALGQFLLAQGRDGEAVGRFKKALEILKSSPTAKKEDLARVYYELGQSLQKRGRNEKAASNYQESKTIWHELGNRDMEQKVSNALQLVSHTQK